MRELRVELGERGYPVYIGEGLLERAHELIPKPPGAEKIMLFCDEALSEISKPGEANGGSAVRLERGLRPLGLELGRRSIRGERGKDAATADVAWRDLATDGFHRNDLVIAFGGGAIGDLAGFVAATYGRGMPWVQVPTTLLAMVDASIGGKTGINLPEGKNLVGAFHQPLAVIADMGTLTTLPDAHLRTGMAEAIKHGLIAGGELLEFLTDVREKVLAREPGTLEQLVGDAASVKVALVSADEEDRGARMFLNYGHTLGHALEVLGGYERWTHGQAVSIGMMFAAVLAARLGLADRVRAHSGALEAYGLPTAGAGFAYEEVAAVWQRDKKYQEGSRFVLLEDLGRPVLMRDVPEDVLREAYEVVR